MTAEPDYAKIQNLTFETTTAHDRKESRASWSAKEVLASAAVMVCILFAYFYFRG
jgi:SSS family solute:Na+ symporter